MNKTTGGRPGSRSPVHLPWLLMIVLTQGCSYSTGVRMTTRADVERTHGLRIPESGRDFQMGKVVVWPDKGAVSMFEIARLDLQRFLDQLKVEDRYAPIRTDGDPCMNGWNVWPQHARTAVPGGPEFAGLRATWDVAPIASEMLSCRSEVGDSLHVEVWEVGTDTIVIKLFTDWN